jgi:hypothetical protein
MKWSLCLLVTFVILILLVLRRVDGFGATSPGTMVQLSTSHVPTQEDEYYYKHVYPKLVQKEIRNMTESDL